MFLISNICYHLYIYYYSIWLIELVLLLLLIVYKSYVFCSCLLIVNFLFVLLCVCTDRILSECRIKIETIQENKFVLFSIHIIDEPIGRQYFKYISYFLFFSISTILSFYYRWIESSCQFWYYTDMFCQLHRKPSIMVIWIT